MRNYAKYCKINLDGHKYQLNLTENGQDDAHFLNKLFSVNFWIAPLYIFYKVAENLYLNFSGLAPDVEFIPKLATAGLITLSFCLPFTNTGRGYNAILRSLFLKNKTKKYYAKMRSLEAEKNNKNSKKIQKKQIKLTIKFLKHLKSVTNFNELLSRKYQKRIQKYGFVDGTRAFANDNIESVQEAVDKFIFHNRNWLYRYCDKYRSFIKSRANTHYSVIKNGGNYYDEYIWSASHKDDMLVKNDCLDKFEDTEYFNELRKIFDFKTEDTQEIQPEDYPVEERKIEKTTQTVVKNIYKNQDEENINSH